MSRNVGDMRERVSIFIILRKQQLFRSRFLAFNQNFFSIVVFYVPSTEFNASGKDDFKPGLLAHISNFFAGKSSISNNKFDG
jgi:hypothetical protein